MLISVCVKAKDLTQALHAADMFRSTGRKLDTILYTNLIGGQRLIEYLPGQCLSSSRPTCIQPSCESCWSLSYEWAGNPDGFLCAVCAAVGDADKAFQLYTSMKAEGVKSDPQVRRLIRHGLHFVRGTQCPSTLQPCSAGMPP